MCNFRGGFNSIRLSATQYGPTLGSPHVDSLKGTDKVKNEALGGNLSLNVELPYGRHIGINV